jgi:hypothetical protein
MQTDNATKSVAINPHNFLVGASSIRQCGGKVAAPQDEQQEQRPPAVVAG